MPLLSAVSALGWNVVYVYAIILGFKQKTYAIPLWALGLNFAWEAIGAYNVVVSGSNFLFWQTWIDIVWCLLDVGIIVTYFLYGKKEFAKRANPKLFVPWALFVFAVCFLLQYAFTMQFEWGAGRDYAAFLQNLLMSVLFIEMLHRRQSKEGQSLVIAAAKWIGTLAPTIICLMAGNSFLLILGILCSVFDIIYILELLKYKNVLAVQRSKGKQR